MNCKKGDIAIMIRSDFPENVGTMYRIIDKEVKELFSPKAPEKQGETTE